MKKKSLSNWFWLGSVVLTIGAVLAAQELRPRPAVAAPAPDTVVVESHDEAEMSLVKTKLGVPEALASCHTATVNGYVIEGHVPAEDIRQLLAKRPNATGLAVPGMPIGSPGMEVGDRVDAYQTLLFDAQGQSSVFNQYGASAAPPAASAEQAVPPAS